MAACPLLLRTRLEILIRVEPLRSARQGSLGAGPCVVPFRGRAEERELAEQGMYGWRPVCVPWQASGEFGETLPQLKYRYSVDALTRHTELVGQGACHGRVGQLSLKGLLYVRLGPARPGRCLVSPSRGGPAPYGLQLLPLSNEVLACTQWQSPAVLSIVGQVAVECGGRAAVATYGAFATITLVSTGQRDVYTTHARSSWQQATHMPPAPKRVVAKASSLKS